MSFTVPGLFTALLLFVTAAAVWYVVLRPLAPYEDEDEDDEPEDDWEERRPVGRRAATEPPRDVQVAGRRVLPEESPRRSGLGDLVAEYRAGEQDVDYAARMQRQPPVQGDPFGGPATGTFMAGEYGMPSPGQPAGGAEYTRQPPMTGQFGMPPGNQATGEYDVPVNEYGRPTAPAAGGPGRPVGPSTGEFARPDPLHGAQPGGSLQPMRPTRRSAPRPVTARAPLRDSAALRVTVRLRGTARLRTAVPAACPVTARPPTGGSAARPRPVPRIRARRPTSRADPPARHLASSAC